METLLSVKKEQNIAVVQKAFENFLKGDIAAIISESTDDIEWESYDNPVVPFGKTYHGKKGVGEFFASLGSSVDYTVFDPRDYYADRDSVLVRGSQEAIVKSTGKKFSHEFLMHFKLRDGKIANFFSFVDSRDEARAFSN
jgi:ketosteroid isomerase-like protein